MTALALGFMAAGCASLLLVVAIIGLWLAAWRPRPIGAYVRYAWAGLAWAGIALLILASVPGARRY